MSLYATTPIAKPLDWETAWGGFNDFPPNWREVDEVEITTGRSVCRTHSPDRTEYRQMGKLEPGGPPLLAATLFFMFDGTGWAMSMDYHAKRVRYFLFGCDHAYRELPMDECATRGIYHAGRCWHVHECSKCHHISAVDSSD